MKERRAVRRKWQAPKTWLGGGLGASAALGWTVMALRLEACAVMGLRTVKLAKGGRAATTEARRMLAEKLRAALSCRPWR